MTSNNSLIEANDLDYTVSLTSVDFNCYENQFYCPVCGEKMYLNGGRYNSRLSWMMEVVECGNGTCRHSVDARLVLDEAYDMYEAWEALVAEVTAEYEADMAYAAEAAELDRLGKVINTASIFSLSFWKAAYGIATF